MKIYRNTYRLLIAAFILAFVLLSITGLTSYAITSFFALVLTVWIVSFISILLAIHLMLAFIFPFSYLSLFLRIFPKNARHHAIQARAYLLRKNYAEAIQICNRALALKTNIVEIYAYRGHAYHKIKEYQKAVDDYTSALKRRPRNANYYNSRGWAYLPLKDLPNAQQDFAQAITYSHNFPMAYVGQGFVHAQQKEYVQARQHFDRAIAISVWKQTQAHAYHGRALVYLQTGEYKKALQDLQFALAHVPLPIKPQVYRQCGWVHLYSGEFVPAVQACNSALDLDAKNSLAHCVRGIAFLGLRNLRQARTDLENACALEPQNASYFWLREWTRLCEPQALPDEAQALQYNALVQAQPGQQEKTIHFAQGFLLWTRGQYAEALVEFEQTIQLDTDFIQWDTHVWKGITLACLKREAEARASIQKALKQNMPPALLAPLHKINPALHQEFVTMQVQQAP